MMFVGLFGYDWHQPSFVDPASGFANCIIATTSVLTNLIRVFPEMTHT